ncbi:phosphoglycolate phosphatase [Emcibacter nanhaiensis]|uniref:Phosphoglycolate phosphatase n=1 Tax=Emcibacter nanhaiensis TaxID=1505037 RepID=A0A501PB46_9PROT|nr:phosphoglycolate phosphatase [Emcibacter nanhaiensis]TPD57311.1 phosphoglycolate phosphatase [Emcibacter nanhaiensis]
MSNKLNAVIFDLDGTLVDSALDLTATLNHVLHLEGRPQISIDEVRHMVGHGSRALIIKGFDHSGEVPPEAELDRLQKIFLDYYNDHIADHTISFPGLWEALTELKGSGVKLAVCTNKVEDLSHKLLKSLGLDDFFCALTGGDSFDYKKPDPRHLLSTLELMGCEVDGAVMVGDSANDIDAARNAAIPVIGVTFGYTPVPVTELSPDRVIDHYDKLIPALQDLMD